MSYASNGVSRSVRSALVAVGVSAAWTLPAWADVTVNPDGDLSTDVRHGPGLTLLTNPVADPLDLGADILFVGNMLKGALEISNGGSVTNGNAVIAEGLLATGLVRVDGGGSQWINNGSLVVGNAGDGVLEISGGGSVSNAAVSVGLASSSVGLVTVNGMGSQWTVTAAMSIGREGEGTLEVTGGGEVIGVNSPFLLGDGIGGGKGTLLIDGEGSRVQGVDLIVAPNGGGVGTVTISGGGVGDFSSVILGSIHIGSDSGTQGSVTVVGPGSQLLGENKDYSIAFAGDGSLEILDGAVATGRDANIGTSGNTGNVGEVTIDGPGSQWILSRDVTIGEIGSNVIGALTVANGGLVSVDGTFRVRTQGGGPPTGIVNVQPGGTLRIGGRTFIAGAVNLLGGTVELVGDRTFDGAGGQFDGGNFATLDEDSLLHALGGGLSNGQNLRIDGQLNLLIPLTIDGGSLSAASIPNLPVIDFKKGTLELTGVDFDVSATGQLGEDVLLITGQTLRVSQTTTVASDGQVRLDGGTLGGGLVNNSGLVRGDGEVASQFANQVGGEVRATFFETMRLTGEGNTNDGLMNVNFGGTIESPNGLANSSAGTISGDGIVRVGQSTIAFGPEGPEPAGAGLVNEGEMHFSGTAKVFGDVWLQGTNRSDVIVSGGAVLSFFDDVVMYDDPAVSGQPEIRAGLDSTVVYFGLVKGDVNQTGLGLHVIEGTLSPGFSPGRVAGVNQTWAGGSTSVLDIAGLTPVTEGVSDTTGRHSVFEYSGTLTIIDGATIDVNLIGPDGPEHNGAPFAPGLGDSFEVLTWAELVADLSMVNFDFADAVLGPGLGWEPVWGSSSGGSLVLHVVPEPGMAAMLLPLGVGVLGRSRRGSGPVASL